MSDNMRHSANPQPVAKAGSPADKARKAAMSGSGNGNGNGNNGETTRNAKDAKLHPGEAVLSKTESALATVLLSVQKAAGSLEASGIPSVAKAVLAYMEDRQRAAGNAQISVSLVEIRNHCYELIDYKRVNDAGIDTSQPAFEAVVSRGIKAALLVFNGTKGFVLQENKIMAPHNAVVPEVKVTGGLAGSKKTVPNQDATLMQVPIRLIENEFKAAFPATSRRPHANKKNGNGEAVAFDPDTIEAGPVMGAMLALLDKIDTGDITLTEDELNTLADVFQRIDGILSPDGEVKTA